MMNYLLKSPRLWTFFLITYLLIIFIVSAQHIKSLPSPFTISDKINHAAEYIGLGICLVGYFSISRKLSLKKSGKLSMLVGAFFGITDEIHQGFVGYFETGIFSGVRQCDYRDWIADCIGLLIGVVLFILIIQRYNKKNQRVFDFSETGKSEII
jgi:VanZ family protein